MKLVRSVFQRRENRQRHTVFPCFTNSPSFGRRVSCLAMPGTADLEDWVHGPVKSQVGRVDT